jgi:2-phospho-L-lactate guanylyltransferase
VRDASGTGTTMYAAPRASFDPAFGVNSAALHVTHGALEIGSPVATLRLDVDEPADLDEALLLGVGAHTAQVWHRQMQ